MNQGSFDASITFKWLANKRVDVEFLVKFPIIIKLPRQLVMNQRSTLVKTLSTCATSCHPIYSKMLSWKIRTFYNSLL